MIAGESLVRDTTAVVLAGGKGTRLGALTRNICKPALPFAAAFRNIDFTLSNCVNSGIRRIGIATQHKPETLQSHIDEVWRGIATDRCEYLESWAAATCAPAGGYRGTADAVHRNLDTIRRDSSGLVIVLAGDHVYRMDYRHMLEYHRQRGADVTIGCVEIEPQEASEFGIVSTDRHGRIDHFVEKPKRVEELPGGDRVLASMGIYVFDTAYLARALRRDVFQSESHHDFGKDILPRAVHDARVFAFAFTKDSAGGPGYWRDVGTPAAYWRAHLELLDAARSLRLDDPCWPLPVARGMPQLTERYVAGIQRRSGPSLIANDCAIAGSIDQSVLFSGVQVSTGTVLDRSVILPGASIGRNCRLTGVVADSGCHIPDGTVIDSFARKNSNAETHEPIVVTADDLASLPFSSCA